MSLSLSAEWQFRTFIGIKSNDHSLHQLDPKDSWTILSQQFHLCRGVRACAPIGGHVTPIQGFQFYPTYHDSPRNTGGTLR
jgi:hypothetical protein